MKVILSRILGALLLLAPATSSAAPIWGDYDGDGKSDLVAVQRNRSVASGIIVGETFILARPSGGGQAPYYRLPVPADAMVHGRVHFGDPRWYPGAVFVRDARTPLEWYFATANGGVVDFKFGMPGMKIPNLGDLDGDNREDIVVITPGSAGFFDGFAVWYISQSSTGTVQGKVFGLATDNLRVADTNGDGVSDLVALRIENGEYVWYSSPLYSQQIDVVRWGLASFNDIPLNPQDVDGDGKPDYIVVRRTGTGQVAHVRTGADTSLTFNLGFDSSVPFVGQFNGGNASNFAWVQRDLGAAAIRKVNGDLDIFGFGSVTNDYLSPTGEFTSAGGTPGAPNQPPPTPPPPPPGQCRGIADGAGSGRLWKPKAETGPGAVVLMPNSYRGVSLSVQNASGQEIARTVRQGCCNNGGREHRYLSRTGSSLASEGTVYLRWGNGDCFLVDRPGSRID